MRYVIEIDTSTSAGKELLKFIEDLNAPVSSVSVRKLPALTDEDMALPGPPVSDEQLEEWLSLPNEGGYDGDTALMMMREDMAKYRKNKKK